MAYFVVTRELPGISPEALQSAGLRIKTCCAEMTEEGEPVRWLRSYFLPHSNVTHCYFEATNLANVQDANARARIPYLEITEVLELTPETV